MQPRWSIARSQLAEGEVGGPLARTLVIKGARLPTGRLLVSVTPRDRGDESNSTGPNEPGDAGNLFRPAASNLP